MLRSNARLSSLPNVAQERKFGQSREIVVKRTSSEDTSPASGATEREVLSEVVADAVLLPPAAVSAARIVSEPEPAAPLPRMRAGLIWVLVFLSFGASMAVVTPLAFSLTVKLNILVPGRVDVLGFITAVGAIASVIATPLVGVLSDRTRSRLGRRRPWAIGGAVAGLAGLVALAVAPSVPIVVVGWVVTLIGWQTASNMVGAFLGDRLPEEQRGRVSAYTGFANMVAPIFGIGLVSSFAGQLMLLLDPGAHRRPRRHHLHDLRPGCPRPCPGGEDLRGPGVLANGLQPRKVPACAWNWLGRALLFFGLSFTTTYATYFLAARLHMSVSAVGGSWPSSVSAESCPARSERSASGSWRIG